MRLLLLLFLAACGRSSKLYSPDDGVIDGGGDEGGTEDSATPEDSGGADDGGTGGTGDGTDGSADGGGTTGSGTGGDTDEPPPDGGGGTDGGGSSVFDSTMGDISDLPCEDELVYRAEIWTAEGGACTACDEGVELYIVGLVANPCDADMELTTTSDYLVSSVEMLNTSTGEGMGMGVGSTGAPAATRSVPAGTYILEAFGVGYLSTGDYKLSIQFADMAVHNAASTFRVE